jgi:thiol-disulfide isomerase/thioredoxin
LKRLLAILGFVVLVAACQPANAAPVIGGAAPDVMLPSLSGETLSLSQLKGKPVLMNFWATWCVPCREEMPMIVDAAKKYERTGLSVLAVNVQEGEALVKPFVDEFALPFPILMDKDGAVVNRYRVRGIPTTVFIDREGIIRSVYLGPMTEEILNTQLRTILGPEQ